MNPLVTTLLFVALVGAFAYSANRRWRLMFVGPADLPFDQPSERLRRTLRFAIGQWRMPRHRLAGIAHIFIYLGAVVMLLRAATLFARGFVDDPHFGFWLFDAGTPLGNAYSLVKDIFVVLVLVGVVVFFYYRVLKRLRRMTLNFEGLLILLILTTLMVSDMLYDGANMALHDGAANAWEPLGSLVASPLRTASRATQLALLHVGFWTHITVILLFLNYLPYCKQFHEITAFPNVYFQPLGPAGRLRPLTDIEGMIEREETLGIRRVGEFGAKVFLDFFTCTECGRCTHRCPANNTGKLLSPKELTVALRNFAYTHQSALIAGSGTPDADGDEPPHRADLAGEIIQPEVLWACTTCRACEQECPLFISYVDKIVDMRRHLVQEKGEFPTQLQQAFTGMETTGSPYSIPPDQRMDWAEGLDVPLMSDKPDADVLFWVGCAPAFDDRSKKVARAMVQLLHKAGVDFACLGPEEQCTGDAARRAGNEYLFQMLAQANVEVLNAHNVRRIVTSCPHCYNTLKHEYADFGGHYDVVHHADFLAELIAAGRLKPVNEVETTVVFHDSCYLGRYNNIYDSPRRLLTAIPGVRLLEPADARDRGMCCGAGGAQMWKEDEPGDEKVSFSRTRQLVETGAKTVASACPFCMRMLSDGINLNDIQGVEQLDVAEILLRSVDNT